jgi:hypothetical protein
MIGELTHTSLGNVGGEDGYLWDVNIRGEKMVVCGSCGAALFKLK